MGFIKQKYFEKTKKELKDIRDLCYDIITNLQQILFAKEYGFGFLLKEKRNIKHVYYDLLKANENIE